MSLGRCDRVLPRGASASSEASGDAAAAFLPSALSLRAHIKAAFLILKIRWLLQWACKDPLSIY